jgi:hypothetical protein
VDPDSDEISLGSSHATEVTIASFDLNRRTLPSDEKSGEADVSGLDQCVLALDTNIPALTETHRGSASEIHESVAEGRMR